jgi:hypothetical protein
MWFYELRQPATTDVRQVTTFNLNATKTVFDASITFTFLNYFHDLLVIVITTAVEAIATTTAITTVDSTATNLTAMVPYSC